jgi:hypothetical protein
MDKQLADIKDKAAKILPPLDFWSDIDPSLVVDSTAGDEALPDIVVSDIPDGATVVRAIGVFKYRVVEDSSGALNYVESDQVIQVRNSVGGTYRDTINLPANCITVALNTKEGGDVIIGDNDIAIEVTGNGTYNAKWAMADAHGDSLTFYDVQIGLRVWYAVQ